MSTNLQKFFHYLLIFADFRGIIYTKRGKNAMIKFTVEVLSYAKLL